MTLHHFPNPMPLTARKLSFAYAKDRSVLTDVSLALAAGRTTVLLGPNGSGKSTLLKLLLGHLAPAAGDVLWQDRPLRELRPRELARHIAYLPQSPAHDPGQTVGEVLRAGRTPYLGPLGLESDRDMAVVRETANLLQLTDLFDRPMEELSGGQRQRVFLGRALAQEPRAFLLDEPNTFLDLRHQADLWRLLQRIAREKKLAILAASHDLNLSAAFADELLLLHEGRLAARGTPEQVLDPSQLSHVYGLPIERLDRPGRAPVVFPSL
jgi:ABC-type cobalamin/Fe3+-siderophores transport system ATPase subunit